MISHCQFQKSMALLGITSKQKKFINIRTTFGFISLVIWIIETYTLFCFPFDDFQDYVISIYMACTTTAIFVLYWILIWRTKKILSFIENCDQLIHERKQILSIKMSSNWKISAHNLNYMEMFIFSGKIWAFFFAIEEKWCNVTRFLFVKVTPMFVLLPLGIFSYFNWKIQSIIWLHA